MKKLLASACSGLLACAAAAAQTCYVDSAGNAAAAACDSTGL